MEGVRVWAPDLRVFGYFSPNTSNRGEVTQLLLRISGVAVNRGRVAHPKNYNLFQFMSQTEWHFRSISRFVSLFHWTTL